MALATMPLHPKCEPSKLRVRWNWRDMIHDFDDDTQDEWLDPSKDPPSPRPKFSEGIDGSWEDEAKMGRSKKVFFSAIKVARRTGDLVKLQWVHGIATNNVANHFTSTFLPWHRKYHLEYENMLRYQWAHEDTHQDEDCPECREYYSCLTIPYWNWAQDQGECAKMNADEWHGNGPKSFHEHQVSQPFINDDGGQQNKDPVKTTAGKGCRNYDDASEFVHDFGSVGSLGCSTSPYCKYSETVTTNGGPMCKKPDDTVSASAAAAWGPIDCQDVKTAKNKMPFKNRNGRPLYVKGYSDNPYDARVGCVDKGPFAGWTFPTYGNEEPGGHHEDAQNCVTRATSMAISNANGVFPDIPTMADMIKKGKSYAPVDWTQDGVGDFENPNSGFRFMVEVQVHGIPHTFIGGNMISYESPGDPMFIGHHSMIDRVWTLQQDFHDLNVLPDLTLKGTIDIDDPQGFLQYNTYPGITADPLEDDWRGRLAYGSYVNMSTGRYNRGANYGYGGKVNRNKQPLTQWTSDTEVNGPYTSFKQPGHPNNQDGYHYPFDTAWPNYMPNRAGVFQDTFDTPMIYAYPHGNKPSKCFLGPQLFTVDSKDPCTGDLCEGSLKAEYEEDNNDCYNCILTQTGPEGAPNGCKARGIDEGVTVIEDYCLMWCGMPECKDVCRVSHTGGRSPAGEKWAKETSRNEIATWDSEHTAVRDYMDSSRMPGYDPTKGKHYVTRVMYADDKLSQELAKTMQGRQLLDDVYHSPVTEDAYHTRANSLDGSDEMGVGAKLNGLYHYRALLPVMGELTATEASGAYLGDGTMTLKVVPQPITAGGVTYFKLDPITSVVGVGCALTLLTDGTIKDGRTVKARATIMQGGMHIEMELLGKDCNGVHGNDWWYAYHGFVAHDFARLGEPGVPANYENVNNNGIIVGTVVRIKDHFTVKPASPTPWTPGTGFTEDLAAQGNLHIKGQSAAFYLTKL